MWLTLTNFLFTVCFSIPQLIQICVAYPDRFKKTPPLILWTKGLTKDFVFYHSLWTRARWHPHPIGSAQVFLIHFSGVCYGVLYRVTCIPASLETSELNTRVDVYLAACPCLGGGCTSETTVILPPSGETGVPLIDQRTGSGSTACDNITVHSISTLLPSFWRPRGPLSLWLTKVTEKNTRKAIIFRHWGCFGRFFWCNFH